MSETPPYTGRPPRSWLGALLRLWLLRPVESAPFTDSSRAAVGLGALWLALWVAIDHWQSQPDPQFTADGIPLLAWHVLGILALAALLRRCSHPAPAFAPVLALTMAAVPLPLLYACLLAADLLPLWFWAASIVVCVYTLLFLARGLHTVTGRTQRTAALAGIAFMAGFCWLTDTMNVIPDVWAPLETQAAEPGDSSADSEAILFGQAARIDQALEQVSRSKSPGPQAFFVGFAGVGDEKVFAQEISLASRVLGARYDIAGRSVSLINDQRDLDSAPLATVSGLTYALRGLAARMNLDQDVLFLSISSHGAEDPAVIVANSQLPLDDLTDEDLDAALRESGIKWRVIIISACYAGGFIDHLRNPQTIVITAAAADRTSFGCSNDRDLTYFGEAFYRDALPGARSLRNAFDTAKEALARREHAEHVTPSNPQAYFGTKMQARLTEIRRVDDDPGP
ncbi:MAG: C13 family peptidase [Gammaproteobacteria bacterium]